MPSADTDAGQAGHDQQDPAWRLIREALQGLRFGSVTVIVQDGVVIQVERSEKKRLPRPRFPDRG